MAKAIIQVKKLGKKFEIGRHVGEYRALSDQIGNFIKNPVKHLRNKQPSSKDFWALKNISFSINPGEVVGIIGRNGAGKSTLLKILSQITPPTKGEAILRGRVASMLEVGTGFHPQLTGRENIYLNGAILGMKRNEIKKKFKEIIEFAELPDFIDTPVKHYSSGMYTRLAFAVAAHLDPEILLVDEVLSVGDLAFQKKSANKMKDVSSSGRTILFVSHSMDAIQNLCPKTILLDKGKIVAFDKTEKVIKQYRESNLGSVEAKLSKRKDRSGSGDIIFTDMKIVGVGTKSKTIRSGSDMELVFKFKVVRPDKIPENLIIQFSILDYKAATVCYVSNRITKEKLHINTKENTATCKIKNLPLNRGNFTINVYVGSPYKKLDYITDAGTFTVSPGDFYGTGKLPESSHSTTLLDYTWK